ncbi:DUF4395 domain-containing protein [Cellulomonas sp. H30R-01]|uniref:DUF4395 domain-containing protein n=1 Tax=Cellulomonas sp. H30R-01 TaxID=2704467 RepID=UPI00138CA663|nr:DUF4395 domain-containing protein [Cellulomonas sp. H30R-01]QHT57114.1 DUF4395 domain-containing protein [Cellulomonas sp. H30R-01]
MNQSAPSVNAAVAAERPDGIDVRGPRFGAGVTAVLLVLVLLLGAWPGVALALLAVVAASFALGVARGVSGTWQAAVFRRVVAPRIGPVAEREDPRPPRFAQLVGLLVTGVGVLLGALGVAAAVPVAAAVALVAAFLNAAFGLCLGCELYLLGLRLRRA